ncbi:MAG: acyltransferase [Bacteroidales bacterium]|nr:acyltransferase [Bacteroidales bacterium]
MSFLKSLARLPRKTGTAFTRLRNKLNFKVNGAKYGKGCRLEGRIRLSVEDGAVVSIGNSCHITGGRFINRIGRNMESSISAASGAEVNIGNSCGISSSCIWARKNITIGNNVNIGADCIILDHDAHSIHYLHRRSYSADAAHIQAAPVTVGDDVLLGTRVIVLKGVTIGARAIVGAGSVVSCDIPSDEIWAGNPAKFIKKVQ